MESDIIVNINDANVDDGIVVPNTSPDSPNTGFLGVDGGTSIDAGIVDSHVMIIGVVGVFAATIIAFILVNRRHYIRLVLRNNKRLSRLLLIIAMVVAISSFVGLKELNNSYNQANAEEGGVSQQSGQDTSSIPEDALSISTTDSKLGFDLGDEPVFGYVKNTVTVTSPTVAGYSLVAYTDSDDKDLVNTTNAQAAGAKIAGLDGPETRALTENTWGFALEEPENESSEVFRGVPTGINAPITLKSSCATTEPEESTDVYIGAYVAPGLPGGTYAGVTINYVAVANVVVDELSVDYNGNGLFFDQARTEDQNTVVYETYRKVVGDDTEDVCGIVDKTGTYMNTFGSSNSRWYSLITKLGVSNPNDTLSFVGEDEIKDYLFENHDTFGGRTVELYATMNYTVHFDANGGEGEMADVVVPGSGRLTRNSFTKVDYVFNGWNTSASGDGASFGDWSYVNQIAKPGQTITLYAQWAECIKNYICYRKNGDDVTGTTNSHSMFSSNNIISASGFKREGYSFVGWNTKADYTGTFFGPNQTVGGSYPDGLILYAMWLAPTGTLQNWDGCDSLVQAPTDGTANLSHVVVLTDERDGNTYAVAKLADGKCWTVQNLRLDSTVELTSANTNNPSLSLTNIYDTGETSNHLTPSSSKPYNASTAPEGWCGNSLPSCVLQSRLRIDEVYGGYYNWYSATAGHSKIFPSSVTVSGDICPAGWRLPTGGTTSGEFKALTDAINGGVNDRTTSNMIRSFPYNFLYSGGINANGAIDMPGSLGDYWSATSMIGSGAYALRLGQSRVDYGITGSGLASCRGVAVRCVKSD
ncbi:InlB B-repeat-containing protein [Candidatus Saccharibacteria bacterium]|nr:InlB B-repeat-containing protein [Candidatus Saccharibacteria bacterium]